MQGLATVRPLYLLITIAITVQFIIHFEYVRIHSDDVKM